MRFPLASARAPRSPSSANLTRRVRCGEVDLEALLLAIRSVRFITGVRCPRCGEARVHRWGRFAGRQRWRCRACGRTFSDLTGTPAAYIKKLAVWECYAACMGEGASVRRSAAMVGVNPTTAFRWRHRLLNDLRARPAERLSGWIELDTTWFPYSEKGQRRRTDAPRRRGLSGWEWFAHPKVSVLVIADRRGHMIHAMCGRRRPSAPDLERAIGDRLRGRPIVCAGQGPFGLGSGFARKRGGVFHDARGWGPEQSRKDAPLVHLQTARGGWARLHDWIARFRGVATRYLMNYLAWHCYVDREWRQAMPAEVLRWRFRSSNHESGTVSTLPKRGTSAGFTPQTSSRQPARTRS